MPVINEAQLIKEAKVFTHYLIGEDADNLTINLYTKAHNKLDVHLTEEENKQLDFILRHPGTIGMVDGALALKNPENSLRKKIYILFAILESNPKYTKYFMPTNKTTLFSVIFSGIKAACNALMGFILLPWI